MPKDDLGTVSPQLNIIQKERKTFCNNIKLYTVIR